MSNRAAVLFRKFIYVFSILVACANFRPASATEITLTPEEAAWISEHPRIRVHNEKQWPPFNYFENGEAKGFSIDYMNLVAKKAGLSVEYITGPTWNEFLEMMKRGELDVMLNIVKTPDRLKYLLYTPHYADNPNTILSRRDAAYESLEQLFGKTVSIPKGFFYEEILKRDFPQINILPVKNIFDSMQAVNFGKADAALGELAVFNHFISQQMMSNLVISGGFDMGNPELSLLNIATRKDLPILVSILKKAMSTVTKEEKQAIITRWIGSTDSPHREKAESDPETPSLSSSLLILVSGLLLAFAIAAFIFRKMMKDRDISTYFGARSFRVAVMVGLSLLVATVIVMNWYAVSGSKGRAIETIRHELEIVLHNSIERLNIWRSEREAYLRLIGRDPELVNITRRLLDWNGERKPLIGSQALADARRFFVANKQFGQGGFFIISPNGVSIGSRRDSNVGTRNFIIDQQPNLIERAFKGEAVFIPPIRSDVNIGRDGSKPSENKPLSMFFAAPITDENGIVLAVLTERIQPSGTLSKILHFRALSE